MRREKLSEAFQNKNVSGLAKPWLKANERTTVGLDQIRTQQNIESNKPIITPIRATIVYLTEIYRRFGYMSNVSRRRLAVELSLDKALPCNVLCSAKVVRRHS